MFTRFFLGLGSIALAFGTFAAVAPEANAGAITHTERSGGTNGTYWQHGTSEVNGQRSGAQLDIWVPDGVPVTINGGGNLTEFDLQFQVGGDRDPAVNYSNFSETYSSQSEFGAEGTDWSSFSEWGVRLDPVKP